MTGRPSTYSDELADNICARISQGESLNRITKDEGMPSMVTVFSWLRKHETFANNYTRAREQQAETFADQMADIADDATNDYMERLDDKGGVAYQLNGEHVQRSRLRIETRKWIAAKLKPKKYGEKLGLTDGDGGPLQVVIKRFTDGPDNSSE